MAYVGSHFGMGLGNTLFIIIFFIMGSVIGIHFKLLSSSLIFVLIYVGSFFGKGNGTTLSVLVFFILGIYLAKKIKNYFSKSNFKNFF
tara:strand:- start:487 stop:750 length:264 start_codon:yes stop_codon:yes gene_type:complete